jgi:hypothetical protein
MTHLKETTMDTRTASKELAEKVLRDAVADDGYGFVTEDGLEALVRAGGEFARQPLLIRFGGRPRVVVPAYDVASHVEAAEADGDYVRDVQLTAQEFDRLRAKFGLPPAK